MRKIHNIIIFSVLWFMQASVFSFAESPEVSSPAQDASGGQVDWVAELELVPGVEVIPDGFGGHFYHYKDRMGNKHITNSIDYIPREFRTSETTGVILPVDLNVQDGAGKMPLEISKLEEPENSIRDPFEDDETWKSENIIPDPLEPVNRVFFYFNDKLYFWILKPVATGYEKVVPEPVRVGVNNFFSNLITPIRAVNCLFQGKNKGFETEIARFLVNSTIGVAGFGDPAKKIFNLDKHDEDLGQTLGSYGLGPGIYINWPVLGPSSFRDTVGLVGDSFLNPLNYLVDTTKYNLAIRSYDMVNETSLRLGEYESFKKAALDPYSSLRDAYNQNRIHKINE